MATLAEMVDGGIPDGFTATLFKSERTGRESLRWHVAYLRVRDHEFQVSSFTNKTSQGKYASARAAAYNIGQNGSVRYIATHLYNPRLDAPVEQRTIPVQVINGERYYVLKVDVLDESGEVIETLTPAVALNAVSSPRSAAWQMAKQVARHLQSKMFRALNGESRGAQVDAASIEPEPEEDEALPDPLEDDPFTS